MNDEVEIQIEKVMPEDLSIYELRRLLEDAEDAILGAIPEGQVDPMARVPSGPPLRPSVRMSLVRIGRGSTRLAFASTAPELVTPAFERVAAAVKTNNVLPLPPRSRQGVAGLQRFSHRREKVLTFKARPNPIARDPRSKPQRPKVLAAITPQLNLLDYQERLIRGETDLFGIVERVGGSTPKVALRVDSATVVRCGVSRAVAGQLGRFLYKWVGVAGTARWSPIDHSIESFRIRHILPYRDAPLSTAIAKLKDLLGEHWKGVDPLRAIEVLRGGDEE